MKMRTKILITIIPLIVFGILVINISFGLFFQNFINNSEVEKIHDSANSMTIYLDEITTNYLGTVNDWAHWDDTYNFIENSNDAYIVSNLTESALQSINTHVMLFLNSDDAIVHQVYYDSDNGLITEFPLSLNQYMNQLINFSTENHDTSGVLNIGDKYYFVATSKVTDSLEEKNSNGKLIIGREIDDNVIAQMERVTGLSMSSIQVVNDSHLLNELDSFNILEIEYDDVSENEINIQFAVPNEYSLSSSIIITMTMHRALYLIGMKQAFSFSIINTIISLIISLLIFWFVHKWITKPFTKLTNDVKSIDITSPSMQNISDYGKDEFSFIRRSIDALMNRVVNSQNELIKNREEMYTTLISIGEGIITVDKQTKILFMNPVAEKMTGWKLDDAMYHDLDTVLTINYNNDVQTKILVDEVFEREETIKYSNNRKLVSKNNETIDIEITAAPIKNQNGQTEGCVLALNDITEYMNQQKQIEDLSYRDKLTGLYNRTFYEKKLEEFRVKKNSFLSFVLIDVNGLKLLNDSFGHESGDHLLIKVSKCLKESIRTEDIVCRIGGDEFVILLKQIETKELKHLIARIHQTLEKESIQNIPISIASGYATKRENDEKIETIFKRAEDMMYHKKASVIKTHRNQTIQLIMKTLFEKNPREESHSKRVSDIAVLIGKQFKMDSSRLSHLHLAALFHDIGKVGIDSTCLIKVDPLSKDEWMEIKKHPQIGHNILSSSNEYGFLANIVLSHHEQWDGKGYPNGLEREAIPLESRIIAVADAFDDMVNDRPNRRKMLKSEAVLIIESQAGKQFDPQIVKIFLEKVVTKI